MSRPSDERHIVPPSGEPASGVAGDGPPAWWRRLLFSRPFLVLLGLGLGFVVFEVSFRVARLNFNLSPFWKYHRVLGWTQVPDAVFDYPPEVVSGLPLPQTRVEFNALGFRDVDHATTKPPGTKRIVVLGDSFCEAVQVNLETTFFRRLQHMLNGRSAQKWEVINLGVGDFGTAQELIALENYGLAYSPDIVVVQIFPLNDVGNNSLAMFRLCKSMNDPYRPYFVESDGSLIQTSAQPVRNALRRHVVSYGVLERVYLERKLGKDPQEDEAERERRLKALGYVQDPMLSGFAEDRDQPPAVAQGWRITELLIEKIHARCRASNIGFMGIVVPFEPQVGSKWENFMSSRPPPRTTADYPERRLGRLFARLGVPSVMLKEVFDRNVDLYFPSIAGHFNPESHRLTAEAVYQRLIESGLVQ